MATLIKIKDHVKQCDTNADGEIIQNVIKQFFQSNEKVIVSFEGMGAPSSNFINTAFINLLDDYDFNFIKEHLSIINSTRTINDMIKRYFSFVVKKQEAQ